MALDQRSTVIWVYHSKGRICRERKWPYLLVDNVILGSTYQIKSCKQNANMGHSHWSLIASAIALCPLASKMSAFLASAIEDQMYSVSVCVSHWRIIQLVLLIMFKNLTLASIKQMGYYLIWMWRQQEGPLPIVGVCVCFVWVWYGVGNSGWCIGWHPLRRMWICMWRSCVQLKSSSFRPACIGSKHR